MGQTDSRSYSGNFSGSFSRSFAGAADRPVLIISSNDAYERIGQGFPGESRVLPSAESLLALAGLSTPLGVFLDISPYGHPSNLGSIEKIRQKWPDAPIVVFIETPLDGTLEAALEAGAAEFICQPVNPDEAIIRLSRILKADESELASEKESATTVFGDVTLNTETRELEGPLGKAFLSPTEGEILAMLITAGGELVHRDALKNRCWSKEEVSNNALDRHTHGIRRALKRASHQVRMRAVYGKGYVIAIANQTARPKDLVAA